MGFIVRAALVVGVIYALSPSRPDPAPGKGRDLAADIHAAAGDAARLATTKALEVCAAHPGTCARLAEGTAQVLPGSSVPLPPGGRPPGR